MVLLFMHIPKAGGSALTDWIYTSFGSDSLWTDKYFGGGVYYYPSGYVDCVPRQPPAHMRRIFCDPDLRAVAGHFKYGIHKYIPQPSAYVTVLREPVDRLASLYYFHRLVQDSWGSLDGVILPLDMKLSDFVRTPLYPEADNGQVRRLSEFSGEIGGCTRDHLELAKRRLADFAVVGVSSRMQEAVNSISRAFNVSCDTPLFTKNENPLKRKITALPASDIEQIIAANQLDAELYEFARRERAP
jgi:hypothetical protein